MSHTPRPAGRSARVLPVSIMLTCLALAGCTAGAEPAPGSLIAEPAPTPAPLPGSGEIPPGTYVVSIYTVPFEITLDEGWSSAGWYVYDGDPDDGDGAFVTWSNDTFVPTDACAWNGTLTEVGSSATAFVDALVEQTSTDATRPVVVDVSGYPAEQFDIAIEPGVDISDCHGVRLCLFSPSTQSCDRYHRSEAERETYRIVDLDGDRAILSVGEFAPIDDAARARARAAFDSIAFRPGG